jgi:glycosyltransferase involved in cell wall biosynthesis
MGKTLVILTPGFAADENDSNCLPPVQQFVRSFTKANPALQVIILAVAYPFTKRPYQWHGCTVIPFNGNRYRKLLRPFLWEKIRKRLKYIAQSEKLTGLLSFWCGEWAMIGTQFAKKHNIPHYCWLQGQDCRPGNKYAPYLQGKPGELIALSDALAANFCKNYGTAPEHTIPFGAVPPAQNNAIKTIDIIGAGSLIPLKQYHIFVQVIHQLKNTMPGTRAILCGKGPQLDALRQLAKTLQLESNIEFTGELPHSEVLRLMQQSKILLHPSSYEGFSTVCTEALQSACHVISFCRAMDKDIDQWHIVNGEKEMCEKTLAILQNPGTAYKPVVPYSMQESITAIARLFGYSETSTL